MSQKNIILEIERMREIMGISPLNVNTIKQISENFNSKKRLLLEQGSGKWDLFGYVFKAMGFEDDLAKKLSDDIAKYSDAAKDLTDKIKKAGLNSVEDIKAKIKDSDPSVVIDDDLMIEVISKYLKKNPDIAKEIYEKTPDFANAVQKKLNTTSVQNILGSKNMKLLNNLTSVDAKYFPTPSLKKYEELINDLIKKFEKEYTSNSSFKSFMESLNDHLKTLSKKDDDIAIKGKTTTDDTIDIDLKVDDSSKVTDDAGKVTDDAGKVSNATNPPIERRVGTGFGVKETLPTDISDKFYELSKKNISELSDDELSFLNAVKEWKRGSDVDFENLLKPKVDDPDTIIKTIETRTPGFFSKLMNNYTIDTLYNIFRGFYTGQKTAYENLIADSKYITETFLPKFSEAGKKIQAGDINGFQNSVRQLFLDFKLSKPYNKSWDDLWEEVKLDIRKNGKEANIDDSTINEFISQIEKGGTNPKNSIESFLKTMENFANKPTILPLGKDRRFAFGNLDAFKEWINIKKFFDDAKASYDNVRTSFKGENLVVGIGNFLYRLPTEIWKWFSGYLVYSAPLRVQTLLARINYNSPRFVPLAATAIGSYLGAVFIDYFVQPVIDSTRYFLDLIFIELFKSPADWFWKGLGLDSKKYEQLSDKNYWDVLFEGYKEPLLKLGEKVITPSLTFQPGPIMLAIPAIIERTKKSKKQVYDEEQNELTEKKEKDVKERLDKAEKRAIEIWNNASYDEKEEIKKKNNFYDYKVSIDNGLSAKLTPEQSKKMAESLDFIPGIDPTVRQNLISGTLKDVVKSELTGKEASSVGDVVNSIKDISGSVVVRDRNKVPYKITRREGNMYYLEPSYDELIKNPNQEPISKRLYKFVDKL